MYKSKCINIISLLIYSSLSIIRWPKNAIQLLLISMVNLSFRASSIVHSSASSTNWTTGNIFTYSTHLQLMPTSYCTGLKPLDTQVCEKVFNVPSTERLWFIMSTKLLIEWNTFLHPVWRSSCRDWNGSNFFIHGATSLNL